jgi:hypothetical protein
MIDHDLQCTNNMVVSLSNIYMYIHICVCTCAYMYIYMECMERENRYLKPADLPNITIIIFSC